jgi:hypothetical protein
MSDIVQLVGAGCFGTLIGWYVYYINRYRKSDIQLKDLGSLIGILGGATILKLFPSSADLFGTYGIGLAVGFFGYFSVLMIFVYKSQEFGVEWFLDGRRKNPQDGYGYLLEEDAEKKERPPMVS